MNKIIVGIIAGAFASTAFAQAAMQTPADKAKQNEVQSITKQAAEGADMSPQQAGAAANKAKTEKGQPKALTTTKEKQAAVSGTTTAGSQGAQTAKDAAAADALKAQKGQPKALATKQEKQQAVSATTKAGAEGADVNALKAGTQADKDKAAAAAAKAAADKPKQ